MREAQITEPLCVAYEELGSLDNLKLFAFLMEGDAEDGTIICVDEEPTGTDVPSPRLEFIAAAVNALPELLAERDRLSAERDALKALCHEASEHYGYGGTFPIRGLMARRLIGAALGDWEPVRAALKGAPDER